MDTFYSIIRALPIAILVLDGDGRIFCANDAFVALSGYPRDELTGSSLDALIPEDKAEAHRSLCGGYRSAPSAHRMGYGAEIGMRAKSGRVVPVLINLSAVRMSKRRFVLAGISDLSELRESQTSRDNAAAELRDLNRELEARIEERGRSLAEAHDRIMDQRRLQKDLETAGQIQASLLPKAFPEVANFDFAARALPSRFVSGDFYDSRLACDGSCSIMLADISGKGLAAALFASSARSLYGRALRETGAPGDILRQIDLDMYADLSLADRFITMIAARLEPERGSIEIANAGGCGVIILDGAARSSRMLAGGGLPIGLFPDPAIETETVDLRPGTGALIYSDGITDAENPPGEFFGEGRLLEAAALASHGGAEDIAAAILAAVEKFREGRPLSDDATLVAIKARPRRFLFDFATSLDSVDAMPARVASACACYGDAVARDIHLALSEALANIREHGYNSDEGSVSLDIRLETRGVEIFLRERGRTFDPAAVPPPALGQASEGGFGLYLIRQTMDHFSYEPGGADGNLWIFFRSAAVRHERI